jgi:hypothetical protein
MSTSNPKYNETKQIGEIKMDIDIVGRLEGLLLGAQLGVIKGVVYKDWHTKICHSLKLWYDSMVSGWEITVPEYNPETGQVEETTKWVSNPVKTDLLQRAQLLGCEWASKKTEALVRVLESKE